MKRISRVLTSNDPPWSIRAVRAGTLGMFACSLLLLGYAWIDLTLEQATWRERDDLGRVVLVIAVVNGLLLAPMLAGALLASVQQIHYQIGAILLPIILLPMAGFIALLGAAEEWWGVRALELTLLVTVILFQSLLALLVVAWDTAPLRQIVSVLAVATLLCVLTATVPLGLLPAILAWVLLPAVSYALAAPQPQAPPPPPSHTSASANASTSTSTSTSISPRR